MCNISSQRSPPLDSRFMRHLFFKRCTSLSINKYFRTYLLIDRFQSDNPPTRACHYQTEPGTGNSACTVIATTVLLYAISLLTQDIRTSTPCTSIIPIEHSGLNQRWQQKQLCLAFNEYLRVTSKQTCSGLGTSRGNCILSSSIGVFDLVK